MVAMSSDFRKRHSSTAFAVHNLRHLKGGKPHVFRTFLKYSGLDEDRATTVLTVTTDPPESRLIPSVSVAEPGVIRGYAKYPGVGDNILLGPGFVDQYEALVGVEEANRRGPKGRFIEERGSLMSEQSDAKLLMESKLLHEIVHWARRSVSDLPPGDVEGSGEVGWKFEKSAYGRHLTSAALRLREYIGQY